MANPQTMIRSLGFSCEGSKEGYVSLDGMEWNDITDSDLLTTLFSMTSQDECALLQAEKILQSSGSLGQLVQMPEGDLRDLIPDNQLLIVFINLMRLGMHRIVAERTADQIRICSPTAMTEYIAIHRNSSMGRNRRVVLLDRDSKLIRDFSMSVAGDDAAVCRKIAHEALKADAFGMVMIEYTFGENLQSSSKADRILRMIEKIMINIDIELHDYLIVGKSKYYSKLKKIQFDLYQNDADSQSL